MSAFHHGFPEVDEQLATPTQTFHATSPMRRGRSFSDLCGFGELEGIFDINPEVPDGVLDLAVAEQDLHGSKIPRGLIDDRGLRSP